MPSGTLAISKTRASPATYRVSFVPNFSTPRLGLGEMGVTTLDELRALLSAIGVVGREHEQAVRAVTHDDVAVLPNVILTDAFIAEHKL